MSRAVIRADARSLPLPDASVDLIVTSPPYYALRSYTDGGQHYAGQIGSEETPRAYVDGLLECTREWLRVLKPEGSLFVNLGDGYASGSTPGPQGATGQRAGRTSANEPARAADYAGVMPCPCCPQRQPLCVQHRDLIAGHAAKPWPHRLRFRCFHCGSRIVLLRIEPIR